MKTSMCLLDFFVFLKVNYFLIAPESSTFWKREKYKSWHLICCLEIQKKQQIRVCKVKPTFSNYFYVVLVKT